MSTFDDALADMDAALADAFGEPLTLLLPGGGGAERAVTGIVERLSETPYVRLG